MTSETTPQLHIGEWVVLTEDGFWSFHTGFGYRTKRQAIEDVSCATMDSRKTPKVTRVKKGEYSYTPKDCDTGEFEDEYSICLVTKENIESMQASLTEQWEYDD